MQDVFLSVSRMDYVFFVDRAVFAEEFVGFSHGLKFDSVTMQRIPRTCQYNGYAKDECLSHVQAEYVRSLEAQGVRSLCFLLTVGNLLCGVRYQVFKFISGEKRTQELERYQQLATRNLEDFDRSDKGSRFRQTEAIAVAGSSLCGQCSVALHREGHRCDHILLLELVVQEDASGGAERP